MKKIISKILIILLLCNLFFPATYAVTLKIKDKNSSIKESTNQIENNDNQGEEVEEAENIKDVEENKQEEINQKETNKIEDNNQINENEIKEDNKSTNTINNETEKSTNNNTTKQTNINNKEDKNTTQPEIKEKQNELVKTKATEEISTGIYTIQSAVNTNFVVEVANLSTAQAANVQLGSYTGEQNQQFKISKTKDGYYTIQAVHSGKMLDVYAGLSKNGTNVDQYSSNGSNAQKWSFKKNNDGTYNIISKCGGLYLDIYAGLIKDGTNIQIYKSNGSNAQKFKLNKIEELKGTKSIENGIYRIAVASNTGYTIGVDNSSNNSGANVELQKSNNNLAQQFKIEYKNDGTYTIQAVHSGKMLDVYAALKANGTNVDQYESNGTEAQKWIIKKEADSSYSIISKCNGLYLDIYAGLIKEGTNVQVYATNNSQAQKFKFITSNLKTINDGTYKINTKLNANMYLEFENGTKAKAKINELIDAQRFDFVYQNDGTYKIKMKNSNKVMGIGSKNSLNGYKVELQNDSNKMTQKWIILNKNGNNIILNASNFYCLDIEAGSSTPGTSVQVYNRNGSNAQNFKIQKVEESEGKQTIKDGIYQITSVINENMLVEVQNGITEAGANVQLGKNNNWKYQRFYFAYQGNGYYTIQCMNSGKLLDVYGGENKNGANVQIYDANGSSAQQWIIEEKGNGRYIIKSKANGLVMDIYAGLAKQGTNIQVYEENGSNAQIFKLKEPPIMSNGTYRIGTAVGTKMVLDVAGGSKEDGANIQIWTSTNVSQQNFKVTYKSNGTYLIEAEHSGKVIQVAKDGKNVEQATKNGSKKQEWKIQDAGNGYYYIISNYNGLYLDIYAGMSENGTNVQVYEKNSSNAQKFTFENLIYSGIDVSEFNGDIDWNLVKRSGIDFVMIRIGYRGYGKEGNFAEDSKFKQNIKDAKNAGLKVGIYFVTQAINVEEIEEEVEWVINKLTESGYAKQLDFPIALDSEYSTAPNHTGRADNLDVKTRTTLCKTFLTLIKQKGYTPMLYASTNWLNNNLDMTQLEKIGGETLSVWLAQYAEKPTYKGHYDIWQYTSEGSILGIEGNVDLNVGYKKY